MKKSAGKTAKKTSPSPKKIAESFLKTVTSGKIREAYDRYVAKNFRHHNPYFKGDAASLMKGMIENESVFPNKTFEIQSSVCEGEMVMVHSRLRLKKNMPDMAVVHIFRIKNGRIAELWDVGQQVPEDSPNKNGMF